MDLKKYYKTLGLDENCGLHNIEAAYRKLKTLYTSKSDIMLPVDDEISIKEKVLILAEIEEAYIQLKKRHISPGSKEQDTNDFSSESNNSSTNTFSPLKDIQIAAARRETGISIEELSHRTGIEPDTLKSIENREYDKFEETGLLRWQISTVARSLDLNPRELADEYMKLYREWARKK